MSVALKVALCAFVLVQCCRVYSVEFPESPCPRYFRYAEKQNFTFGSIFFKTNRTGINDLEVNMSIPIVTNKTIKIDYVVQTFSGNNQETDIYFISFPFQHTFPKLTSMKFNGRIYCTGTPYTATADHGVTPLYVRHTTSNDTSTTPTTPTQPSDDKCGVNINYEPLVISGFSTSSGEYPWLVALFIVESMGRYTFICGGTLVSKSHVITAANCVKDTSLGTRISKNNLVVVLGKHNIKNWVHGSTIRTVKTYYVHPQYTEPADYDIAVIVLAQPVSYSATIRAVCMWDEDGDLYHVIDKKGTVAGWGKHDDGVDWVEEPKQIELSIVSQETCLRSNARYLTLTSTRTFCAGSVDGARGPCSGDGGGGFVMNRNGVWKLRGIVSTGLVDSNSNSCDVNNYIVFTDVPKYATWVKEKMMGH